VKNKKNRRGGRKGGKGESDDEELRDVDVTPMSEATQAFVEKKDQEIAEQNEMLDEIATGLDELLELGKNINTTLKLQDAMLNDAEVKMNKQIATLQSSNSRLKEILEETGGLTRWIPMAMCCILLLALLGYMAKTFV